MKRWFFVFLGCLLVLPSLAAARPYVIDYKQSSLTFEVSTLYPVKGSFSQFQASVDYDEKQPEKSKISAIIRTDSIQTGIPRRDEHLKEADFFNTDAYRRATFQSTKIQKDKQNNLIIDGTLTIRGIAVNVQLTATVSEIKTDDKGKSYRTFTATTKINRHDFEVSHSYDTVGPYVTITIQLTASPK